MKSFLIMLIAFSYNFSQAKVNIADFTDKSIIFLIKVKSSSFCDSKKEVIKKDILPLFQKIKKQDFDKENIHFLVKEISLSFRLLSIFANREIADYDVMVRIDLNDSLTEQQLRTLSDLKLSLRDQSENLVMFLSSNYQFHKSSTSSGNDIVMAFINRWQPGLANDQAQDYWLKHHGPLVIKVGLPEVVKSYTQVHTDIKSTGSDLFDATYQGLSFETITSQSELVKFFILNPEVRKLNEALLEDEKNFTPPPLLFSFETWLL